MEDKFSVPIPKKLIIENKNEKFEINFEKLLGFLILKYR
jgi:hypothetical protein